MKAFPAKLVMAAIILSCGFVMQVEQSEKARQKQDDPVRQFAAGMTEHAQMPPSTRASW